IQSLDNVFFALIFISSMSLNSRIKASFWKIEDKGVDVLHSVSVKPFEHLPLSFTDERVNVAVKYHNDKWFHNEIVVRMENTFVEPQYCYAINGIRTIIGISMQTRNNLPSPIPILKAHFLGQRKLLKKAIIFDGSMGVNYFHFISDVLNKIYLLEKFTKIDCPLLVSRQVYSKPFFQYFITETKLSGYDWLPIDEVVKVEELYIARPLPYGKELWLRTKALFIKKDYDLVIQKAIFINRIGTRNITNFEEIESILNKYSVEIVEPGNLNVAQQAALFNAASHIIGIHGAGMTNLVFCNHQKVKVLELCWNNRIGTQYYWLCQSLGIDWDMHLGGAANANQSFELEPEKFERRLMKFLAS
nr:glycosyltransferase family 61 protein [Flavobacteriales bacterium]